MNVDEDDTDILVRASLAIIPLHYLQTLPTPKLLTCITCLQAFQPSSALSHVHEHKINLTHVDKDMLKKILKAHNFIKESKDVPCPKCHNPPIEGIMIHNRGLACDLCDYCAIEDLTMRNHFAASHKGTPGFSKVNSSPSAVQAFFLRQVLCSDTWPSQSQHEECICSLSVQRSTSQMRRSSVSFFVLLARYTNLEIT
jgi:hypothetical protein